jgi:hypothetical protein
VAGLLPPWLRRWGISLGSLLLGLATLFLFRRGLPHVGWIVGYLLLLGVLVAVVAELSAGAAAAASRRRRFALDALEYTIQTLCHNLFLFVLPAYYASATLTAHNALFLAAVVAGALVTAVDPWYRAAIAPRPWAKHALLGLAVFAALNVALPLVRVRPILALEGAAALAALTLAPVFRRGGRVPWRRALARAGALAAVALVTAWVGKALVPPAPLFLARATAARTVAGLEPVDEVSGAIPAATVMAWGGIAAYTAVHAPAGLSQPIAHVWRRDGQVVARIALSPVLGGRAEGFRTWSRRTDLTPPLVGRYTVDVVTASGQLVGRLRFSITPGV